MRKTLFVGLLLAAHVTGCKVSQHPDERPNAGIATHAVGLDKSYGTVYDTAITHQKGNDVNIKYKPGLLSGIGNLFSTPEGRANRQAVKLAKAGVPRSIKVKDGAFSWGGDAVAIGKKAGPSIIKSDSATQQVATNAVAGKGNTATQTATETKPGFWGALLGNPVGQIGLGIIGLFIVGAGVYGFVLWKKKKQITDILA